MRAIRNMIGALMVAAAARFGSIDNAVAEEQKESIPVSGSVSAAAFSKNILSTGKPQSEYPAAQLSGNLNVGSVSAFTAVNKDKEETREIDLGAAYQRKLAEGKLGKLTAKVTLERKGFPNTDTEMYLTDVILSGANKKLGDASIFYRERFDTKYFDSGRFVILGAATPALSLGKVAGMDVSLKGTAALCYQDAFVGTSSEWSYVTPGVSLGIRKGNTSIEAFLKDQKSLRKDLDDITYGGVKATYSFGKKK